MSSLFNNGSQSNNCRPYGWRSSSNSGKSFAGVESATKQQFKRSTNINEILNSAMRGNVMPSPPASIDADFNNDVDLTEHSSRLTALSGEFLETYEHPKNKRIRDRFKTFDKFHSFLAKGSPEAIQSFFTPIEAAVKLKASLDADKSEPTPSE
nr:MAG: hypothetical protein [Microvirus sp.]